MPIVSNVDNLPTYFDQLGNILAYGKLKFFAKGTTTPKAPYWDEDFLVPASTEQLLLASGKTDGQLFLGYGDYYVQVFKFFGTDPTTADPSDWQFDHQYDIGGLPLQPVASITASLNVTTIPNLRLIDGTTSTYKNFEVMGYWTEGDIFPRTYVWSPNELGADNQGTIIRNPLISTGAFVLSIAGPVTDCRIFGIIPGRASSNNASIASMVTTVQATPTLPQTIYFPRGIYEVIGGTSQYFDTNVYIDQGAQFKNTSGSTTYSMVFRSTFTNQSTSNIQANTSTGSVLLKFENRADNAEVDPRWFGCVLNGSTDDGVNFQRCITNTYQNYPIKLVGIVRMATLSSSFTINNPIHCYNVGGLMMAQSTYTITFSAPGYISNKGNKRWNGQLYPVFYGYNNVDKYKFSNYPEIRTSWFASALENVFETNYIDTYLSAWNSTMTDGTIVVVDYPVNNFSSAGWILANSNKYVFRHDKGTLVSQGIAKIYLPNFHADSDATNIFASSAFFVCSGVTYAIWWTNITGAIQSVFSSGGILDLGGHDYTLSASVPITITNTTEYSGITIQNGRINSSTSAITFFNVTSNVPAVIFNSVYFFSNYASTVISFDGCTCSNLLMTNCKALMPSGTLIKYPNSGKYSFITISDSDIQVGYLFNDTTIVDDTKLVIHDNKYIACDVECHFGNVSIHDNYISGGSVTKAWKIGSYSPARINGNHFEECDLAPMSRIISSESRINHVISSNSFHSTELKYSRVLFTATEPLTYFRGAIASDNLFTDSLTTTTGIKAFNFATTGTGGWGTTGHNLTVDSNSGGSNYLTVNTTKGYLSFEYAQSEIPNTSQYDIYMISRTPLASVLVIPGSAFAPLCTGNILTNYNNVSIDYLLSPYITFLGCNDWTDTDFRCTFQNNRTVTSLDPTWKFSVMLSYTIYSAV